ncbi:MAG: metal-sensitive transcriptional regulator [Actinomycetota bacterium]
MYGYHEDKAQIIARLRRIEGQVRGLQRLVEADEYCIDILTQVSATTAGLRKVAVKLLGDHLNHCVAESVTSGADPEGKVSEATAAVERLLKA